MKSILKVALLLSVTCLLNAQAPRRAPGFSLPDLKLEQHDLIDLRGKVVLLDFIQTGCPACRVLSGALEEVKAKFGDKVAVLTIVTPPDNQATVARFVSNFNVSTPVLFDCGQVTASYVQVMPDNPQVHFPHLFIVDREGMIRSHSTSESNPVEFESKALIAQVEQLLPSGPTQRSK
jgi:peroxiredoxin